jgi:hypothetical protein
MKKVTDPDILAQLNAPTTSGKKVTDPVLLSQLNGTADKGLGFFDQAASMVKQYQDTQLGSPQDLLGRLNDLVAKGTDKAGTMAAEQMGKEGQNPYLAAGVGTAISMSDDLAALANPMADDIPVVASAGAKNMAQRALGLSKRHLKTPFARGKANEAAEIALEEGVIPWAGSRTLMQSRAADLQNKTGKVIGDIRKGAGNTGIEEVVGELESLRSRVVQGAGGIWDKMNTRIDEAIETIRGMKNEGATLVAVAKAKKIFGDTVNWLSDNASQGMTKKITNAMESGIKKTIKKTGGDLPIYKEATRRYGASKKMLEGIDNATSAEQGNNLFGPIASITGGMQLATGNVPGAAATLGLIEALKRRGSSSVANLLYLADRVPHLPKSAILQLLGSLSEQGR